MAKKYHVKKDGTPGVCHALFKCPLGDESQHFSTLEEAQEYADKINEELSVKRNSVENYKNGFLKVLKDMGKDFENYKKQEIKKKETEIENLKKKLGVDELPEFLRNEIVFGFDNAMGMRGINVANKNKHFSSIKEAKYYVNKMNNLEQNKSNFSEEDWEEFRKKNIENKSDFSEEDWEEFRKEIIEKEEKKNTVPYFNENEMEEIYRGIKYSTVDSTEKPKKEIKSIQIPSMTQEEVQDEIDYHLNREEGRKYESLGYYTHEILNDKSMLGNEDNEFINTLRKEFGDKTNKIIQPERSFEDTVSQVLFDKGLRYAYEYDYKNKEERDEYINSIKSEFKPKFEINGEKFYVSYAEGKGNFFDRLNRIAIDKYNSK